ncbi:MAG: N-acetylmuramoyl-L-alanine amidase [Oscillospiraceae bacterium]|nr:N-acetylmuramoyl-L-alanine amidase [Oscillospiraceae bacterium]
MELNFYTAAGDKLTTFGWSVIVQASVVTDSAIESSDYYNVLTAQVAESLCTGNSRYKAAEPLSPEGVVLHSIGCPQPNASVLQDYWDRDASPYVVHYIADDHQILHCMPDYYKYWHVGSPGNGLYLGIEMGEPSQIKYTSGATFTISDVAAAQAYAEATYCNAVWLIAHLCTEHGWDPYKAVWTHGEITRQHMSNTDHVDPEHLWNGLGMGYSLLQLRRDVASNMAVMSGSSSTTAPAASSDAPAQLYRIRKAWEDAASQIGAFANLDYATAACSDGYAVFDSDGNQVYPAATTAATSTDPDYVVRVTAQSGLNVRKGPGTGYGVVMSLPHGGGYTIVEEQDGWGKLKSGAGWICLKYTERV